MSTGHRAALFQAWIPYLFSYWIASIDYQLTLLVVLSHSQAKMIQPVTVDNFESERHETIANAMSNWESWLNTEAKVAVGSI
jgi:hypothetical protein